MQQLKKWIVSHKVLITTTIIYIVLVGSTLLALFLLLPKRNPTVIPTLIPEVQQIVDENGRTAALIKQYNMERTSNKSLIDSLAEALRIKPKEIKGIDNYITVVDTIWRDSIVYIPATNDLDSTIISKRDDYVDILAVGKKQPHQSYINFRLAPDTVVRILSERKPLFGRPSTDVYLRHSNPYYNTVRGNSFTIDHKQPLFSIGISVGYDVIGNRLSIGPTITKPIKTFYKK